MHAFRHRSSQFTSFLSSHTSCTLVGLVQKGSKGAYDARFVTGVATANVDSTELKEPYDHKSKQSLKEIFTGGLDWQTEESFYKVLDSVSTSSRSIPARTPFENRSDYEKNTGRRVDMVEMPEWKLILGDDQGVGKEKRDELVRKQKSMNQVKESNTITGGERSVCIEYVPRGISLFHIREALAIHGEIVGSFFQNGDNAMPTCYIEFKTIEAKERALAARWVFVNGKQLSIWRSDFPVTTIVRITNLSSETTATTVHSVCMSYGNVENLQIRKDGSMDVHYSINELLNMPKILEMLNEVAINDSHWIAQPSPRLPQGLAETPEGQKWVGKQLSNHIGNIKKHLQLMRIYLEDMEELHNAVMHIKECPKLASNQSFSTS